MYLLWSNDQFGLNDSLLVTFTRTMPPILPPFPMFLRPFYKIKLYICLWNCYARFVCSFQKEPNPEKYSHNITLSVCRHKSLQWISGYGVGYSSPQRCDKHHRRRTLALKSTDKFRIINYPRHSIPTHSLNIPILSQAPLVGCGYTLNETTKEETFFNHSDHLGSASYITDDKGNITQYDAYLPYGELLVDEHSSSEELPYKFNGKQVDEETGLYYYDARYLNPMTSLWHGGRPTGQRNINP